MFNSPFLQERACPNCDYGKVQTSELSSCAECSYCHKLIEVDFKYKVAVGGGFIFFVYFFLYLQYRTPAGIVLVLYGIYNALLHQITNSYFPLKFYDDT